MESPPKKSTTKIKIIFCKNSTKYGPKNKESKILEKNLGYKKKYFLLCT